VKVGITKGPKVITLTNSGHATLNIGSITPSGDFALVTGLKPCGATPGSGKALQDPSHLYAHTVGSPTGNVTITDNAPDSPQLVPLSGTGK